MNHRDDTPKGRLLIIGGAEDKGDDTDNPGRNFEHYEILLKLLPESRRKKASVEVITSASGIPVEMMRKYRSVFQKLGFAEIGHMRIEDKKTAADKELIERIRKTHAVFLSGGDQFRLAAILGGTPVMEEIHHRYREDAGFLLAGTSAGAMAASALMIYQGDGNVPMRKGNVKVSSGLGFVRHCIIDTHFVERGRFGRLVQAVMMNPHYIGVGLGEDAALLISQGDSARCLGSGMVIIIDASRIRHTNMPFASENEPLSVENLTVHILKNGDAFVFSKREFIPDEDDVRAQKK